MTIENDIMSGQVDTDKFNSTPSWGQENAGRNLRDQGVVIKDKPAGVESGAWDNFVRGNSE